MKIIFKRANKKYVEIKYGEWFLLNDKLVVKVSAATYGSLCLPEKSPPYLFDLPDNQIVTPVEVEIHVL